ncbi:hypothetical protein CXG81DRAFT_28011, partial [Caulochytrium protostelioides]
MTTPAKRAAAIAALSAKRPRTDSPAAAAAAAAAAPATPTPTPAVGPANPTVPFLAPYSLVSRRPDGVCSLKQLCWRTLERCLPQLATYLGEIPYHLLEPLLRKCNPELLYAIEEENPTLVPETEVLWRDHCLNSFREFRDAVDADPHWTPPPPPPDPAAAATSPHDDAHDDAHDHGDEDADPPPPASAITRPCPWRSLYLRTQHAANARERRLRLKLRAMQSDEAARRNARAI